MKEQDSYAVCARKILRSVVVGCLPGFILAVALMGILDVLIGGMLFTPPVVDAFFLLFSWFFVSRMLYYHYFK